MINLWEREMVRMREYMLNDVTSALRKRLLPMVPLYLLYLVCWWFLPLDNDPMAIMFSYPSPPPSTSIPTHPKAGVDLSRSDARRCDAGKTSFCLYALIHASKPDKDRSKNPSSFTAYLLAYP
ncbi:hypothetical protein BDN71DRAFT_1412742, partial [Pleurotus eryngii]